MRAKQPTSGTIGGTSVALPTSRSQPDAPGKGTGRKIQVLVTDDHPLMRGGIEALLRRTDDIEIVSHASDGAEAVQRFIEVRPDIVLMDLRMPGLAGFESLTQILREDPGAKVIVVTSYAGDILARRALKLGAAGFLTKLDLGAELVEAIRIIFHDGRYLQKQVAVDIAFGAVDDPLSDRDVEILTLASRGNSNKQIARRLELSENTVKGLMTEIFAKLRVNDRTHAVAEAARRGVIDLWTGDAYRLAAP